MISKKLKFIIVFLALIAILSTSFFYFRYKVYHSHGSYPAVRMFKIEKGEGNGMVSENLKKANLISGKIYFYYYMQVNNLTGKILPGDYELSSKMTIPEIANIITHEQNKFLKLTFPEGWDSRKIAERLSVNGFSESEFLDIVKNPSGDITKNYSFFSLLPQKVSLEGYLFPDTYFFSHKQDTGEVVKRILTNFDNKLTSEMRDEIKKQGKSLEDTITMASIIEREVKSDEDKKTVSGIFWNRIKNGQPLQSCATIAYILGESKKQYSFDDTRIESPYNTYLNQGLPPGPISNPGISSIEAAIYPRETLFNFFLSDPETGKTVFSKTIEEHNANKVKFGL
jgi:UPF0755 protein